MVLGVFLNSNFEAFFFISLSHFSRNEAYLLNLVEVSFSSLVSKIVAL